MRIVSKFHDYYDTARGFYSQEPLYVRDTEELQFENKDQLKLIPERILQLKKILDSAPGSGDTEYDGIYGPPRSNRGSDTQKFLIGFCGKIYLGYRVLLTGGPERPGFWSIVHCYGLPKLLKEFPGSHKDSDKRLLKSWDEFVGNNKALLETRNTDFFVEEGVPIFAILPHSWGRGDTVYSRNPMLKDWGFQTQWDPYSAFQEIEMFVGGVLSNVDKGKDLVRTDKAVAEAAGFDDWSFRKNAADSKKPRRRGRG